MNRYVFVFTKEGAVGTAHHQLYSTDLKSDASIRRQAVRFVNRQPYNCGEVWLMPFYTQDMYEMEPAKLKEFIQARGRRIL